MFQVRGFFLFGFCLVLENQASVWFSSDCFTFVMADKVEVLLYSFTYCGFYSEEDLQTYLLYINFAVWFGNDLL